MSDDGLNDSPTRTLVRLSGPALLIGVGSALSLLVLDVAAEGLDHVLWGALPRAFGISEHTPWWIVLVLTAAGFATGLLVRYAPGHAGPDPATESFFPHALPLSTVPGLAAAAIITLAAGVSLGPEAPIIAINVTVAVWACRRLVPEMSTQQVTFIVVAATFGALFGSPVGAALLITSAATAMPSDRPLWDRLFLPLVAASAASIVVRFAGSADMTIPIPTDAPDLGLDLLVGVIVMAAGIAVGVGLLFAFPRVHRLFHRWRNPILPLTVAGLLLGLLGAIGGPITLFKGLDQMKELAQSAGDYGAGQLAVIILVKTAAVLIATTSGFRGGRVFPAVFIGVAIGALAWTMFPGIPPAFAAAAGALGVCLVVVRDGWLSLFIAAIVAGDVTALPLLCMIMLPGWLAVARLPQMRIPESEPSPEESGRG